MATCNNPGATKVFGHAMPSSLSELNRYKREIESGLTSVAVKFRKTANGPLQDGRIQIQRRLAPNLQAAMDEIAQHPEVAFVFGGSYCFRGMNNGKANPPASIHSLGLALDVNVPQNPYARDNKSDDALHMRTSTHPIVAAFKKRGWVWGGDWSTPDYMHFEFSSGNGELDGAPIEGWENELPSSYSGEFGSTTIGGGGYRIGECPEDIKFKRLWNMYRAKSYSEGSTGANYGPGCYDVPGGFPSNEQLQKYLYNCEGHVTVKWARSADGAPIVSGGQFGYDLPGGVHDISVVKAAGLSLELALGRPASQVKWIFCRKGLGAEIGDAYTAVINKGSAYESDIQVPQAYWDRLVPYYRSRILEGWNTPIAQREPNLAKRWALCHGMCWGYSKAFANPRTPYYEAWKKYSNTDQFIAGANLQGFIKNAYKHGCSVASQILA